MFTPALIELADAFKHQGFQIRVVGGAVRDFLLGEEPKDIDLCTDATPTEMLLIANAYYFGYIPTGLQHGTVTIVVAGEPFEVTTLRVDVDTDGRHAEVAFTKSFEEDAARRDLTINAMSMDFDGNIYDYFGGREDLKDGRVRFVGDPDARVKEDYLRILRYFRFLARFGRVHDNKTTIEKICTDENLLGLLGVSVERYWLEMQKLVKMPYANNVLNEMEAAGVLGVMNLAPKTRWILPEMSPICALSTMVLPRTVETFLGIWKLSRDEQDELRYLGNNRNQSLDWKNQLVDGIPRQWVGGLALLDDDITLYDEIMAWNIPQFPLRGQDLLDAGMRPGKDVGEVLRVLKSVWKTCYYDISKEHLLDIFHSLVDEDPGNKYNDLIKRSSKS